MEDRQDRPPWALRIRAERDARGWSQRDAVKALRAHSSSPLPDDATLLRNWKRWEGGTYPDDFYRPLIAKTFGTVTTALFPNEGKRNGDTEILAVSGTDTLEVISRLRASDVNAATLDGLRITVDRLCSEYPYMSSEVLRTEGQQWLRRMTQVLERRLTLAQHREVLSLAGWLALLVGCVEYDMGDRASAEATRKAALSLGTEAGNAEIIGWAHEMRAWFALTQADYRGVISASEAGRAVAGGHGVTVQLAAQAAKAWARVGDRRQLEVALDQGLLESLPYPDNLDNHFVVDPTKFDFYAMDCYRILGEDKLAETYAKEIIRAGTGFDGNERSPMRNAEARVTLGVLAARRGELEQAISYGERALEGERKSLPSLLMTSRELAVLLRNKYGDASETADYLDRLRNLKANP
jgi:tetratricopeptide (TPR) repeat protein